MKKLSRSMLSLCFAILLPGSFITSESFAEPPQDFADKGAKDFENILRKLMAFGNSAAGIAESQINAAVKGDKKEIAAAEVQELKLFGDFAKLIIGGENGAGGNPPNAFGKAANAAAITGERGASKSPEKQGDIAEESKKQFEAILKKLNAAVQAQSVALENKK